MQATVSVSSCNGTYYESIKMNDVVLYISKWKDTQDALLGSKRNKRGEKRNKKKATEGCLQNACCFRIYIIHSLHVQKHLDDATSIGLSNCIPVHLAREMKTYVHKKFDKC